MFLVEIDRPHRLLKITFADHVPPPGFRLLSDLSGVKSMPTTTAPFIGQIMELCAERGLESVVRVLPSEPRNDIGYAILSQFHYGPDVRIVTCDNVEQAASHLAE